MEIRCTNVTARLGLRLRHKLFIRFQVGVNFLAVVDDSKQERRILLPSQIGVFRDDLIPGSYQVFHARSRMLHLDAMPHHVRFSAAFQVSYDDMPSRDRLRRYRVLCLCFS